MTKGMKNVLFVASDNARTSGAFLCMVKLCQLLRDQHDCNVIVALPGQGDGKPLLDAIGIKTYLVKSCTWAVPNEWSKLHKRLFGLKMWVYNIPAIRQLRRIIRQEKIDILHINTSWTYVGAKAALKENCKFVWHLRELLEEDQNRHIVFRKRGYNLIKKATKVFTVSDFVYNKYRDIVGDKLVRVYEGLDAENYYTQKEILTKKLINLLCIGLIVEKKGQWQVIEACKTLVEKGISNFKVNIVGRGARDYISTLQERVCQYHLENNVVFCGSTSNVDMYYKQADIVAMSSAAEAFGRTTVEAMLEGCLVIGADAGATPELLGYGECGLIYPYGDTQELAKQLQYAIEHPAQMQNIARKAQQFALDNFTAEENASKVYEQYTLL